MSFHEVVFPEAISYGALGGPKFKTTVMTLASGHERRNVDWSRMRCEFDVSYGLKTQDELDEIRAFFYARRGRAYGFRFRDWQDYVMDQQVIGTTNGTQNTFQIFKRYQSGPVLYDRVLNKIEQGSVTVRRNGSAMSVGGTSGYTINLNTGVITVGSGVASSSGDTISVECRFHVPVRFDTDHLATSLVEYNVFVWGQIPLIEVRV